MSSLYSTNGCCCVQGIEHFIDPRLYLPVAEPPSVSEILSLPLWEQKMIKDAQAADAKRKEEEEQQDVSISSEQLVSLVATGNNLINKGYTNITAFQIDHYYAQVESLDHVWTDAESISFIFTHSHRDNSIMVPVLALGTPVLIPNEMLIPGTLSISVCTLDSATGKVTSLVTNSIDYHVYAPKIKPVDFKDIKDFNLYYNFLSTVTALHKDFKDISEKVIQAPEAEEFRRAIEELGSDIQGLQATLVELSPRVSIVEAKIAVHTQNIADIQEDLSTITERLTDLEAQIDPINESITSIQNDLVSIHTILSSYIDTFRTINSEIFFLKASDNSLKEDIEVVNTKVANLLDFIQTLKFRLDGVDSNIEELQDRVSALESLVPPKGYYTRLHKKDEYLYEAEYDDIDYDFAYEYMKQFKPGTENTELLQGYFKQANFHSGACSVFYKDGIFARNLDWNYSEEVSFVVTTPNRNGRYATLGIADTIPELTKDVVESRTRIDAFKILPFRIVDGINECGLVFNYNVVPSGDRGATTGTNPLAETEICIRMLGRYLLDYCKDTTEAIRALQNDLNIYAPFIDGESHEIHLMIADQANAYIVEFIDGHLRILQTNDGTAAGINLAQPIMTNFYVTDSEIDYMSKHIKISSLSPHSHGTERYNIIADELKTIPIMNPADALTIMRKVNYTQAYTLSTDRWLSEFVDDYTHTVPQWGDITIDMIETDPQKVLKPANWAQDYFYNHRSRTDGGRTWQTVHTSVYDIPNRKLYITTQEQSKAPFEYVVQL